MYIKPKLDKNIPKQYLYLKLDSPSKLDERIAKYKGSRKKDDIESRKGHEEHKAGLTEIENAISVSQSTGAEINLYNNKLVVKSFTKSSSNVDFSCEYVVKIIPTCCFKSWESRMHNESYDLYAFKVDKVIKDMDTLLDNLKNDNLLDDYVFRTLNNLMYGNNECDREQFLSHIKEKYPDATPCIYSFYNEETDYDGTGLKEDVFRSKIVDELYKKGLINLHHKWGTYCEGTIEYLLKNRLFDILDDFIDQADSDMLIRIKEIPNEKFYGRGERIRKMVLTHMDNPNVVRLADICNIKQSGYNVVLKQYYTSYRDDSIVCTEHFDSIEDVKKWIIRNYECDVNRVARGDIDGMCIYDIDDVKKMYGFNVELIIL